MKLFNILLCLLLLGGFTASAQLIVKLERFNLRGQKIVIPIEIKNNFNQDIESAKAAVFLTDASGKMLGQSSKWAIGGSNDKPGLSPGKTNKFY